MVRQNGWLRYSLLTLAVFLIREPLFLEGFAAEVKAHPSSLIPCDSGGASFILACAHAARSPGEEESFDARRESPCRR